MTKFVVYSLITAWFVQGVQLSPFVPATGERASAGAFRTQRELTVNTSEFGHPNGLGIFGPVVVLENPPMY